MAKKKLTSRALQAKETKKRIISSGKKLIQSEGFDHVSVNEISKNAGITVGTFYYYFNSKDELLYEMMPKMKDYFKSKEAQQMKEESSFCATDELFFLPDPLSFRGIYGCYEAHPGIGSRDRVY